MVAYFDLENLQSFLQQPKNDFYNDCLKLIKNQLDLTFNFSKDEFKNAEDLQAFLKVLSDGVGNKKIKFLDEKFPSRNLKSNSHKTFDIEQLLSVYFINNEDIQKLRAKEDLLIADVGEEMQMFKLLFLNNNDYKFEKKLRIGYGFDHWSNFRDFYTPHMDIIIVDNYILDDKSLIYTNLKGIIENSIITDCRKVLNIIIFIKGDKLNISISELRTIINPIVNVKYTDDPKITIVKHYSEHDRTILRNMLRVYSGDSFNYFLANGTKTTNGKEIHLTSIADKENYDLYLNALNDLQKTIDNSTTANIVGDKSSRFLNFP